MEACRVVVLIFFITFGSVAVYSAEDAIIFTLVPDSITFNTVEAIHSKEVADIFSAMLSYSLPRPYTWQSLGPVNPLKGPKAMFILHLVGLNSNLQPNIPGTKFPLESLNDLDGQYTMLALRTNDRFGQNSQGKPVLMKMNAIDEIYGPKSEHRSLLKTIPADADGRLENAKEDPDLARTIQEGSFNVSREPDRKLMVELATMKMLLKAIESNKAILLDGAPDIFWIEMQSFPSIVQEYGADSNQAKEAIRLLEQTIMQSITALDNAYDGRAVMAVITETSHPYLLTRKTRHLLEATNETEQTESESQNKVPKPKSESILEQPQLLSKEENLFVFVERYSAYQFDDNFHVAFALTAFTSILLILTVLGVSVGMWFMDPGRDSIIYRMTSQRKKD